MVIWCLTLNCLSANILCSDFLANLLLQRPNQYLSSTFCTRLSYQKEVKGVKYLSIKNLFSQFLFAVFLCCPSNRHRQKYWIDVCSSLYVLILFSVILVPVHYPHTFYHSVKLNHTNLSIFMTSFSAVVISFISLLS